VKCPRCNAEVPKENVFCNVCGYKIKSLREYLRRIFSNPVAVGCISATLMLLSTFFSVKTTGTILIPSIIAGLIIGVLMGVSGGGIIKTWLSSLFTTILFAIVTGAVLLAVKGETCFMQLSKIILKPEVHGNPVYTALAAFFILLSPTVILASILYKSTPPKLVPPPYKPPSPIPSKLQPIVSKAVSTITSQAKKISQAIPKPSPRFKICPVCGAQNPVENLFCNACGASLSVKCKHCGASIPSGLSYCPSCGAPLT